MYMRISELLERSVNWDKRVVDFLGDCSKHCFTATTSCFVLTTSCFVLTNRDRPLQPLMLSCTFPVSLILSRTHLLRVCLERFRLESLSEISV